MGRNDADKRAVAGDERRRLDAAISGIGGSASERRIVGIYFDVLDNHRLAIAKSPAASGVVLDRHLLKGAKKLGVKTVLRDDRQAAAMWIEQLHIAELGVVQGPRAVERGFYRSVQRPAREEAVLEGIEQFELLLRNIAEWRGT